jgi:hypothetical protein
VKGRPSPQTPATRRPPEPLCTFICPVTWIRQTNETTELSEAIAQDPEVGGVSFIAGILGTSHLRPPRSPWVDISGQRRHR